MGHGGTWLASSAGDTVDSQRVAEDARSPEPATPGKSESGRCTLGAPRIQFAIRSRLIADKAVVGMLAHSHP